MEKLRIQIKRTLVATIAILLSHYVAAPQPLQAEAVHNIYSIYRPIDLGFPGENTPRDYFVNMGANQGVKPGAKLRVLRKAATYDVANQKAFKDMIFPIALLKVIHVESNAAIARLAEYAPVEATPAFSPRAVMVGDLVELNP